MTSLSVVGFSAFSSPLCFCKCWTVIRWVSVEEDVRVQFALPLFMAHLKSKETFSTWGKAPAITLGLEVMLVGVEACLDSLDGGVLQLLGDEGHDLLCVAAWLVGQDLLGRVLMCIAGYVRFGEEGNE